MLSEELGSRVGLVYTLEGFATLAAAVNKPEDAVRLMGAAAAMRAALEHPISTPERAVLERWLEPASRSLGDGGTVSALAVGEAVSAGDAVAYARALAWEDGDSTHEKWHPAGGV
jgi:hypothetical protein